jgi:hypothetical protein
MKHLFFFQVQHRFSQPLRRFRIFPFMVAMVTIEFMTSSNSQKCGPKAELDIVDASAMPLLGAVAMAMIPKNTSSKTE